MAGRPRKVQAKPELELTPEEITAIKAIRARQAAGEVEAVEPEPPASQAIGIDVLAAALTQALKDAQPVQKKTVANRIKKNPWSPKDGSPKILKFRRPMYHHGIELNPKKIFNEDCLLLDKIKPGTYCGGWIRVTKRKDNGLDIDYPIRTASQRLKLGSQFGITSFNSILHRIVDERNDPRKYAKPEDLDDLD